MSNVVNRNGFLKEDPIARAVSMEFNRLEYHSTSEIRKSPYSPSPGERGSPKNADHAVPVKDRA